MRRFILKLLIIVLPVGLTVIVTNYLIDPANIFSGETYIEGIANIMSQNHNVDNLTNYDERMLQEQMIKRLNKAPDVVVLGSSRVMEINSGFFPDKKVLNCGVSHGNLQDILAITGALDSMHMLPKEIVLGLDYWLICQGGTLEWQSLYPYHEYMVAKLSEANQHSNAEQSPNSFRKLSSLFSLNYFNSSIHFLLEHKSKKYKDVGLNKPTTYGRFSDGSICYGDNYTHPDLVKLAIDAKAKGRKEGLPTPDTLRIKQLDKLLDYLKEKEIKVHLTMLPIHPEFYKGIQQYHKQVLEEWEPIFKNIATKHQIAITGSFNAESIGMTDSAFYDDLHCSGESIKKCIPDM